VQVANNLKTVFENGNLGNGDEREAFLRFWDAFSGILWDPHRLQAQKSAVSCFSKHLPLEQWTPGIRSPMTVSVKGILWDSQSLQAHNFVMSLPSPLFIRLEELTTVSVVNHVGLEEEAHQCPYDWTLASHSISS